MRTLSLGLALALAAGPADTTAQTILDEGVFQLSLHGEPLGTETFVIQRTGAGADASILARGRIVRADGTRELRCSLQLQGNAARPVAYELIVEGDSAQRILARASGRRFSVRAVSPTGERMREYLLPSGTVLLDDAIAHHYFFVARRLDQQPHDIPIIIPRHNAQVGARLENRGADTLSLGERRIEARQFTLRPESAEPRHIWIDDRGRVLRVTIPDRGFVATRENPPD